MTWTDREIEKLFRRYKTLKARLKTITPKMTTKLTLTPTGTTNISDTERVAVQRADILRELGLIRKCMRKMTKDEKIYIRYRYFLGYPLWLVLKNMPGWNREDIYFLRTSILKKAASILESL